MPCLASHCTPERVYSPLFKKCWSTLTTNVWLFTCEVQIVLHNDIEIKEVILSCSWYHLSYSTKLVVC